MNTIRTGTTLARAQGEEVPIRRMEAIPSETTTSQLAAEKAPGVWPLDRAASARKERPSRPPQLKAGLKIAAGIIVGLVAACGAYLWWSSARTWVKTDNAYVAGHIHLVSARVSGTILEVLVDENQSVDAGQLLARLDPSDLQMHRRQSQAQVAQAAAQIQQAEAQGAQARAQLNREQARATKAEQDLGRAESLFQGASGAISRQEFDQAKAERDAALAGLEATRSALDSASALATAAQAQAQAAAANLEEAELQLSYTQIRAPAPGRIGKKNVETGNRVQPGQALLGLVEPDVWVTANFKETQLARLKPGQAVRVKFDAFPGRTFTGQLQSVAPASGAQFALLPPDNATGNFTRIVQRIPVKVRLNAEALDACVGRLAPGMSAIVEVKVRE